MPGWLGVSVAHAESGVAGGRHGEKGAWLFWMLRCIVGMATWPDQAKAVACIGKVGKLHADLLLRRSAYGDGEEVRTTKSKLTNVEKDCLAARPALAVEGCGRHCC